MATTTNYSWTTPDDTALVKDGAAAIRSLGTAIDTTVFTNAGAAVAKATVDAKGDLIAGTADNTVARLAVGANDTVLVADSSTATGLKWGSVPGSTYAIFTDTKASGTNGGTFTTGAWRTRDLQTSQFNNISGCSLASNQITLPAGTYKIEGNAEAYVVGRHQTRIYNVTNSVALFLGRTEYADSANDVATASHFIGIVVLTGTKVIELQHQGGVTRATDGFGVQTTFGDNVYSVISIEKVA
jgi:hypothetical protein